MHSSSRGFANEFTGEERPAGCVSSILLVTSIYVSLGVVAFVAWEATGNVGWVVRFFRVPGALLLVWLALIEYWLTLRVRRQFPPGEALHTAWGWISLSALCQLLGAACTQVLAFNDGLNFLARLPNWTDASSSAFRQVGLLLGGLFRYGLLATGLMVTVRAYRRAGFLGRLRVVDRVLLWAAGAYVVLEFAAVARAIRNGKHPGLLEVAGWPVDPLLVLLLGGALLLHRSARGMGPGWRSRCWASYSIGILLVLLGDVGLWLTQYGYLTWPSSSVVWYIWLPAGCAFALAPAHRLETICRAVHAGAVKAVHSPG